MSAPIAKIGYDQALARRTDIIPFSRMSAAMKLYDDEKLWDTWSYLNRTRPTLAAAHMDLDYAIAALRRIADRLAFIESVVGYEGVMQWLENGEKRAREVMDERARAEMLTPTGEAS